VSLPASYGRYRHGYIDLVILLAPYIRPLLLQEPFHSGSTILLPTPMKPFRPQLKASKASESPRAYSSGSGISPRAFETFAASKTDLGVVSGGTADRSSAGSRTHQWMTRRIVALDERWTHFLLASDAQIPDPRRCVAELCPK